MASIDLQTIIQDLNKRFAAPLPEFYKRRIVVWHDDEKEFADKIAEIELAKARIVTLSENNNFAVKKLLNFDDTTSNFLLYCPLAHDSLEDNWLLDIELFSEEFRADLVSMWMAELAVPQTQALRACFKNYRKFFNAQARRNKIAALKSAIVKPAQLTLAIMAVLAEIKEAKPASIIRAMLQSGLDMEANAVYKEFCAYGIDKDFWEMTRQGTGYLEDKPSLKKLATHLLITASTRTLQQEYLSGLEDFISSAHQSFCYDLVSDWISSPAKADFYKIAELVENECKLPQRLMSQDVDDIINTECFSCVDEVILIKLMTDIGENFIDVDAITKTVERRRSCAWYANVKNYYDALYQVAQMQAFYKEHAAGFHTVEPRKVWRQYEQEYYKMDTYYRLFHQSYAESLRHYNVDLNDPFSKVKDVVEGLYTTWFLGKLGENWSNACADNLREYGRVLEVPRQTDFYARHIAASGAKVYVIISDALRYEVAASLTEQLQRETQAKVKLSSMQGIFPTTTKFGMAALLPHKQLSVEVKPGKQQHLAVLVDGQPSEAPNRDKLLKDAEIKSVALKYKDIIGMKRAERHALVKGMKVVYIYHDTIDEAGHSDSPIFRACNEAIAEIKNMVRIIANEFGGVNILITADHGFLYTYSPLLEDSKVDKTTGSDQDIEFGRRHLIMKKGAWPKYLLPVKFLEGNTSYEAFTPRENVRIKMKGGGVNYVHGGVSLQEMVVPLIEYRFLRSDSKEYKSYRSKYDTKPVSISILSASRKISNKIFNLNFFQTEPVSANREQATYQIYFTDDNGVPVSDIVKLIADKISSNEQERIFKCRFNLKARKYNAVDDYYLVITDAHGMQVTRENFHIDIPFSMDGFDFFS